MTDDARVVYDLPDPDYRATPGASYSGLKRILDCPARYRWETDNPQPPKDAFDFGHVVHGMVLGVGEPVRRLNFPDRRTSAYRDAAAAAREAGMVPLLADHHDRAAAAADAVLGHPLAGPLLTADGRSEVSLFWTDDATGQACKGRIDRVVPLPDGTDLLVDLKTIGRPMNPDRFARQCAELYYHLQAAFYTDGWKATTGRDGVFMHVTVEVDPPHFVTVAQLDGDSIAAGAAEYRRALDTYRLCRETGTWPGYTDAEPALIRLPAYALTRSNDDDLD